MTKSTVVDASTGKSVDSLVRTSSGTFLDRGQDRVVKAVEQRIAVSTMIPEENGEGFQILRYEHGQHYSEHLDWFHDQFNAKPETGGNRVATLLMYLSDVLEGGETVFPSSTHFRCLPTRLEPLLRPDDPIPPFPAPFLHTAHERVSGPPSSVLSLFDGRQKE